MRTFFEAQSYKFIKEYLSLLKIKYEQNNNVLDGVIINESITNSSIPSR